MEKNKFSGIQKQNLFAISTSIVLSKSCGMSDHLVPSNTFFYVTLLCKTEINLIKLSSYRYRGSHVWPEPHSLCECRNDSNHVSDNTSISNVNTVIIRRDISVWKSKSWLVRKLIEKIDNFFANIPLKLERMGPQLIGYRTDLSLESYDK